MYQNTVDLHVHTDNSPDGRHAVMLLCERAELLGIRAVAFCDHCETDSFYESHYDKRVRHAYFEMAKAQSAFRGKVLVLKGIELGQPHHAAERTEALLGTYRYDMVLGAVHRLPTEPAPSVPDGFTEKSADEYFRLYLRDLLKLLEWGHFDVLAHFTYPLRRFFSKSQIGIDMDKHRARTDEVLKLAAEKEKALEINSSGLREPLKKLLPEFELVKRFRELGGKYVTFGSDAHRAEEIGLGLEESYEMMKAAGYDKVTLFQQRYPLTLPIE